MIELNKVYCSDNLELLKQIDEESLDLIYCDILYNTGKKFKLNTGEIAYIDNIGNKDEVFNFYRERFNEFKRVLNKNGNILIQCDYRISPYVQILLDELFEFKDKIIWKRCSTGKGAKVLKPLSKDYDEIFYYSKAKDSKYNIISNPHDVTSLKEYKYYDDIENKYFKIVQLGMYSKISIEKMRANNEIYATRSGKEYKKYYLKDMNESILSNIWVDCNNLYNGENKEMNDYPTQKPKALLQRIIYMFSNEGDIVADFFMGSGTSMVVAKELGRQFIGCDINPRAVEITNNRLDEVKKVCV